MNPRLDDTQRPASSSPPADHGVASDEDLVNAAQHGDVDAFDDLVTRYMRRIYSTTYHMTSNHETANDLAQETFIKAFKNLHKFKGDSSFYTWLYRIAVNHTINYIKRQRPPRELSLDDLEAEVEKDAEFIAALRDNSPRRETHLVELQLALNEAIQKLSEPHRMVVTLHELQGMSHGQIARIMKCSEGTVRSRLFYARQQLQNRLKNWL